MKLEEVSSGERLHKLYGEKPARLLDERYAGFCHSRADAGSVSSRSLQIPGRMYPQYARQAFPAALLSSCKKTQRAEMTAQIVTVAGNNQWGYYEAESSKTF